MDIEKGEVWQLFQKGSSISHSLTTSGLIFIGCEECDIILQSPGVEKRHAVISYDTLKQEFWIKDLNSVTGTYINGVRIPEQSYFKLSHEDSIRFGYGPIFTLKRKSSDDSDNSRSEPQAAEEEDEEEDDRTDLVDSLEDIRESMLSYSSSGSRTLLPSSNATNNLSTVVSCSESNNSGGSSHSGNNTSAAESPIAGTPTHQPQRTFSPELESNQIRNFSHFQNPPLSPSKLSEVSINSSTSSRGSRTFSGRDSAENNNLPSNSSAMSDDRNDQNSRVSSESKKEEVKIINGSSGVGQNGEKENPAPVAAAPMTFTIPFDSDSSSSSRTFTRRKPPTRLKEKQTQHHENWNGSPTPQKLEGKTGPLITSEVVGEPLSETASYLIQRMLGETEPPRSPVGRLPLSGWETSPKGTWIKKKKSPNCPPGGSLSSSSSSPSHQNHPPSRSSPATSTPSSPLPPPNNALHSHSFSKHSPVNGTERKVNKAADDNEDTKSETGTYTVDTELIDPQVDEARKKIDEVFGLQNQKKRSESYSNNLSAAEKLTDKINCKIEIDNGSKTVFKSPYLQKSVERTDEDQENFTQTRMIPIPPQRPPRTSAGRTNASSKIEPNLTSVSSRSALALSTPGTRRQNHGGEGLYGYRKEDRSSRGSSRDALSDGCSPPPQRRLSALSNSLHSGVVTGSHRSNSLGGEESGLGGEGYFWRRKSWNLSCSDLDNNKSETGSVVSDISTSTEPSSHSSCCGSNRHRNNSGRSSGGQESSAPTMRLNRAFALRRARLGFESDDALVNHMPQSSSPLYSSTGGTRDLSRLPPKNLPINQPRNATNLGSNLSRHDGGRFSLRLPRGSQPVGGRLGNAGGRASNVTSASPSSIKPPTTPTQYQQHSRNNSGSNWVPPANQRANSFVRRESAAANSTGNRNGEASASTALSGSDSSTQAKSKREVSALDGLVITAVYQLSNKLKSSSCDLLERERLKYPERSEGRLMIDEVLPSSDKKSPKQAMPAANSEGNLTRDLSSILKNLKKVQQTLEVLSTLSDQNKSPLVRNSAFAEVTGSNQDSSGQSSAAIRQRDKRSFFIVDV